MNYSTHPKLLRPFPIAKVYAGHNFAYEKRIPTHQLVSGKENTQKIERDHLRPCLKKHFSRFFASEILRFLAKIYVIISAFGREF